MADNTDQPPKAKVARSSGGAERNIATKVVGTEATVTLISPSGSKFPLPQSVALQSGLIQSITGLDCAGGDEESENSSNDDSDSRAAPNTDVPITVVDDCTLTIIVRFLEKNYSNPLQEIEKPLASDHLDNVISDPFYLELVDTLSQDSLFKLISAANFMHIPGLLDLACAKVSFLV